ncbi:hypothetical protein EJ06DRAFT_288833 [Trichodelitschia bisporula]|uniref:PHD-type domain-containing protein n=1 Tax=Trichodelitschia bisporula TaxID=703511 RepID=A0A6G1I613_9PEZI|nr:hypothetical protein EJ06DRAFT_288833 [Trichodelitschia bisporula]
MAGEIDAPDKLPSLSLPPSDPDAQATVGDFVDFTEHFPSELLRAFTLVRQLDKRAYDAAAAVHELTASYGRLPSLPPGEHPDAATLRAKISEAMTRALTYREVARAEARCMYRLAFKTAHRIDLIKKKLEELPKPPSRDPTPHPPPVSPQKRKGDERGQKITLHDEEQGRPRTLNRRKRQAANNDVAIPRAGDASSEDETAPDAVSDDELSADVPEPPARGRGPKKKPKARKAPKAPKVMKQPKEKRVEPKPPLRVRGWLKHQGTNVHSAVAGISTSNALAKLTPPPEGALRGSKDRPWLYLTDWEMAKLRKQMKKNAIWTPSDTMIRRQLVNDGRGEENYKKAKAEAEAKGEPFLDELPPDDDDPEQMAARKADTATENRGMRLNEAKKLKKQQAAKEQADKEQADKEATDLVEQASLRIAAAGDNFKRLFANNTEAPPDSITLNVTPQRKEPPKSARKRKRDADKEAAEAVVTPTAAESPTKRSKGSHGQTQLIAPKPALKLLAPAAASTSITTTTTTVPLAPAGPSSSPRSSKSVPASSATAPLVTLAEPTSPVSHRTRMSSVMSKESPPVEAGGGSEAPVSATLKKTGKAQDKGTKHELTIASPAALDKKDLPLGSGREMRPRSRGDGKAASAEPAGRRPGEGRELRERRASVVDAYSVVEPAAARTTRRGRRPAPGLVTAHDDKGKSKVSISKRKAGGTKRGAAKKDKEDEGDADGADADERYCLCGDVSYDTMIACENDECEKEWFHLPCVDLVEIPPRRTPWYCPECRDKLGIDAEGNAIVTPEGEKRGGRR